MSAERLITLLVLLLAATPVSAERLVFGSFGARDNADAYARSLTATLGHALHVAPAPADGTYLFRVQSERLDPAAFSALRARARALSLAHWRLLETAGAVAAAPVVKAEDAPSIVEVAARADGDVTRARERQLRPAAGAALGRADSAAGRSELDWDIGLQGRTFQSDGYADQSRFVGSVSVQPDFYRSWGERHSLTFSPFARYDSEDSKRTHADVRELFYSYVGEAWDVHVGAQRVFWGVTEFHHLVDVINQTDLVENIDTEDKLGQPMVRLSTVRSWGVLDLFALTGFRERTFPGDDGRFRLPVPIADDATYASGAQELRLDGAIRWSHHLGPLEFGVHHFSGTSRDPLFEPRLTSGGTLELVPHYVTIDQTGVDAQAIAGDWVFKLEGISRSGFGPRYEAFNLGVERTLVGVMGTRTDLGLVVEYMHDERGAEAFNTLFESDVALGGRFQFNDFANTQALVGFILDTDRDDYVISLEASRELNAAWALSIEGRVFSGGDPLPADAGLEVLVNENLKSSWLQQDDYLQLELTRFF